MKFDRLIFSIILLINLSCSSENQGSQHSIKSPLVTKYENEYNRIKKHTIENKLDVVSIINLGPPQSQRVMLGYMNTMLSNDLQNYLILTGKGEKHIKLMINWYDYAFQRIEKAKNFSPTEEDVEKFEKLKSLIVSKREKVERYIKNPDNNNYNQTDLHRTQLYNAILKYDIYGMLNIMPHSEEEFDKSFDFLIREWDEISSYY